jgi:hypothetical protein
MHLGFGGARPDRSPGNQVGGVLRGDGIQEFGRAGQAYIIDLQQQAACQAQTFVDPEAIVETRIVDQALPADGRARLFEVDAHHDQQIVLETRHFLLQSRGVFDGRIDIVNRTRADHDQQAIVGTVQDTMDVLARFIGGRCSANADRKFAKNVRWRDQLLDFPDANVVGVGLALQGHEAFSGGRPESAKPRF